MHGVRLVIFDVRIFCSSKIAIGRSEERMTLIASILSIEN